MKNENFENRSELFFFALQYKKKLNKSCYLDKKILFLKKKVVSLKKPPRYVLWCCGGISHQVLTFIQIGCGHTVFCRFPGNSYFSVLPLFKTNSFQLIEDKYLSFSNFSCMFLSPNNFFQFEFWLFQFIRHEKPPGTS